MAEYIVDGARLICDKGAATSVLSIPASRIYMGGKLAANKQDCVPEVNVFSFGTCSSGTYLCSPKAKPGQEHPCVLDLMDHYFLTDEKAVVSNLAEIMAPLENCMIKTRDIIGFCVNEMTDIQHQCNKKMNYQLSDMIAEQYGILWKKTENIYIFHKAVGEVCQAIIVFIQAAQQNCAYLREGIVNAAICQRLDALLVYFNKLTEQSITLAGLPGIKEKQMVTTESLLVCKCGGIITFDSSGQ